MPGLNGFDHSADKADRAHAKRYDAWFKALPKAQQDRLREEGAGPYCEARSHDYVFPVYERSEIWAYNPNEDRTEQDAFISREQVASIVNDVVQMLGYTRDPKVRRHWELMRLILRAPGHLNGKEIGKLFGVTKQAISIQAKGMLAHIDKRRAMSAGIPDTLTPAAFDAQLGKRGVKASLLTPPTRRVASTPRQKKTGVFGGFDGFSKKPKK
ncbi:hypothetical protein UFOVP958_38 [uncultured Caudovirales phage]|uniref:Uncharacterized protein n=1 Tax=uncultured Caudovirales phage TaxID=2100421 RepID=A0A6J5N702_9CAUD|nr:hypothetical protein UFOVP644_40 [uncultured Caudovirales phage]CAB4174270.1 hypothetical protein UFOVP958_38 [uncultured Caudovirales phage]CAB4192177.1 hypothetical protein UFOVP1232_6 [uncultured Caudovirales phage]CAB5230435.1 hypothetical protein UFOVP1572_7 [uncultured Caudovirales phage]